MIRLLALLGALVGLSIGMAFPGLVSSNQTGWELAVALTPPTKASGQSPYLNCGWHDACVDPWDDGPALDWDDAGGVGSNWYFRGFFYVENTSRDAFKMYPLEYREGDEICDEMTVWITEKHSEELMAVPVYMHTELTTSSPFTWSGSQWTTYHSKKIGETIDDDGTNCSFSGTHVHEYHLDIIDDVDVDENRDDYETGLECHVAATCDDWKNNDIANWTRSFTWDEGVASH